MTDEEIYAEVAAVSAENNRAAMGDYVSEAFFTYENMREDRDHWRGRAEVAEDELVLSIGHAKQLRAALIEVRALAAKQSGDYSPAIVSIVSGVLDGES